MTLALTTSQPGMKPAGRNAPTLPDNPWPMRRLYPVGDYRRGLQLIALEECDEVAAAHYARTALAALSAIEGGGGALQPSASVPTEQADGGVVGNWLEGEAERYVEGLYADNPADLVYDAAEMAEAFVAGWTKASTPPATPIAGGFGSNRQGDLPTEPVAESSSSNEGAA